MRYLAFLSAVIISAPVFAQNLDVSDLDGSDVVILGEVHDNPRHHHLQASVVAQLQPAALVFEMLTPAQAGLITDENRRDQAGLQHVLDWKNTGWPDFSLYYPIFASGQGAKIYGAGLTRTAARQALETGIVKGFGPEAPGYGLDQPLPTSEQSERETFQREAHCNALPDNLLPGMVGLQRLRDAYLARAVVNALNDVGAPVVVITGNGHARKDRGLAVYLARVRPEVSVFAVGLAEDGHIDGVFDQVLTFAGEPRSDPCRAFQKSD